MPKTDLARKRKSFRTLVLYFSFEVTFMNTLFSLDSPLGQKLTLMSNLVLLNLLWILCSLPVVTLGASTSAMYHVIFLYITHQDDAVVKPFFKAFASSLKQATPVWILHLLVGVMLVAEAFYLSQDASDGLKLLFGVIVLFFLAVGGYLYPLMGRYDTTGTQALWNSLALTLRHPVTSFFLSGVRAAIGLGMLLYPALAWKTAVFWTLIGFSLVAYLMGLMLIRVFSQYTTTASSQTEGLKQD